jgi:GntR family transcriptional regulator, transcriptional repressor for pyruvate dehydrogenase complex
MYSNESSAGKNIASTSDEVPTMPIQRIQNKKNYEMVADQLLEMIRDNTLKPGDKLDSVEKLAQKFKVGRSAIREALSALRAMGLIEIRQGEGTFVNSTNEADLALALSPSLLINQQELLEFLEVRKVIESATASITAVKRTPAQLQEIKLALDDMKDAIHKEGLGEQADVRFHLAIAKATQNTLLVKLVNQITDTLRETMRETRRMWLYDEKASVERLYQEHRSIYEAIVDRNSNLAQQLMLSHLDKVEKALLQFDKRLQHTKQQSEPR